MLAEIVLPLISMLFSGFILWRSHKNEMNMRVYYAERENDLHRELKVARDAYTSIVEAQRKSVEIAAASLAFAPPSKGKRPAVPPTLNQPTQPMNGHMRRPSIMVPESEP